MARQQQRQEEESQVKQYIPVGDSGPTVAFPHGVMTVGGRQQDPQRILEAASSNGLTKYTAIVWRDPDSGALRTSCNCPGWAIKRGATRSCKHTEALQSDNTAGMSYRELLHSPSIEVTQRTEEIMVARRETGGRTLRHLDI